MPSGASRAFAPLPSSFFPSVRRQHRPTPIFISLFLPSPTFHVLYLLCTVYSSPSCQAARGSRPPFLVPKSRDVPGEQQEHAPKSRDVPETEAPHRHRAWGISASPTAPGAGQPPYQGCLAHLGAPLDHKCQKLTEDATLPFLHKTARLKGSSTRIPYSQHWHQRRASTNKFPSKAVPRRHLPKNLFSTPCACRRLLKQLSRDCSLAGHFITAPSLLLRSSRLRNSSAETRPHLTKRPTPREQKPGGLPSPQGPSCV